MRLSTTCFPFISLYVFLAISLGLVLPAQADTLKIGGSGGAIISISPLVDAYRRLHPDHTIEIVPNLGSGGGIRAAGKGAIHIALAGRPPKEDEQQFGLTMIAYAKTPLVFIAAPDAGITNITRDQLTAIYAGTLKTWPNGTRIRPIIRPENESDSSIVKSLSPEITNYYSQMLTRDGVIIAQTDPETGALIAKTPGAIGFLTLAQLTSSHSDLRPVDFEKTKPTTQNIQNGSYSLIKTFHLYFRAPASGEVTHFLDFMRSKAGEKVLRDNDQIPLAN